MWIRNEEDLRAHLQNPAGREGHAFEYKGAIDNNPKKGRGADFASSVGSLANADGGQVLVGVREKDGAPDRVVGVDKLDDAGKDIEDSISNFLVGIEPRPTWQPLKYDEDTTVIVVDVLPSVRLVAYWSTGEREKIMYPVRTGDRLTYMRPGDVEARVLTYGPRAQRIVLEQLQRRADTSVVALFSIRSEGKTFGRNPWGNGTVRISQLDDFGLAWVVKGYMPRPDHDPSITLTLRGWLPYQWVEPVMTRAAPAQDGNALAMLGLVVHARVHIDERGLRLVAVPA